MVSEMSKSILTIKEMHEQTLKFEVLNEEFKRSYMTTEEIAAEVREKVLNRLRVKRKWDEKKHRESIYKQSTEGNHDVQQGSSREDT
jgi:hypothetical protein